MYQQFSFTESTYAAQRVNVATFEEADRVAVERAYAALSEARDRFLFYAEQLRGLLESIPNDSSRRYRRAQAFKRQTVNTLSSRWFEILENWLLLDPGQTDLKMVADILPGILEVELRPTHLEAGTNGRRFVLQQHARLQNERTELIAEELTESHPVFRYRGPAREFRGGHKQGGSSLHGGGSQPPRGAFRDGTPARRAER
jgi:hypothetical protein